MMSRMNPLPLFALAMMLVPCVGHRAAQAQSEPPIEVPTDAPPEEENRFAIGLGAAFLPAYHGADSYRVQPLPALDIKYGRFFANFQDGIGAHLIDTQTVSIGAGITMADHYRAKDAPRGVGGLSFGVGVRGFVKVRQAGFEAVLGGTKIVAGSTAGFVADASLSYPIMVSPVLMIVPSVGTSWADRKHLNRYFGITAQQSAASGLRQFRLGRGFLDAKAEIAAQFRLTDRIGLGLVGGMTSLIGDAGDSPIVRHRTRPYGLMFASYSF